MKLFSLLSSGYPIHIQKNTPQVHMEQSPPGQITCQAKNNPQYIQEIKIISNIFSNHNIIKLDINYTEKKTIKNTNTWRLNNTLLNNQQITEETKKKEIKICIETNENEKTTTQNLWDSVKVVLSGRFIAIESYLAKQEINQINNLTLHLKQLEKEE